MERLSTSLGWAIVVGVLIGTGVWLYKTWEVTQPLPFNHKLHVDFGITCVACHIGAEDGVRASIPNVETCALCHTEGKEGPKTPPDLEEYIKERREIPWKKIYESPEHVRFSHKRHVEMAGLECKVCHGDVGMMEKAVARQKVPLNMTNCLSCHAKEKITTDCMACHK